MDSTVILDSNKSDNFAIKEYDVSLNVIIRTLKIILGEIPRSNYPFSIHKGMFYCPFS
jgi:hypothetical protein